MHRFAHFPAIGENVATGLPVFGFIINDMFIHEPDASECGRFKVDPLKAYGISEADARQLAMFNALVDTATQAALNAGCREVQDAFGVLAGDLAGMHFSGTDAVRPIAQSMCEYIQAEYQSNVDGSLDEPQGS